MKPNVRSTMSGLGWDVISENNNGAGTWGDEMGPSSHVPSGQVDTLPR